MANPMTREAGEALANAINRLARWLGVRDVYEPTVDAFQDAMGLNQADAVVLYGGSILAGADEFVSALRQEVGKTSMVSGGRGHSTEGLIATIEAEHPGLVDPSVTEADAICAYLAHRGDPLPQLVENRSTNCGNNVAFSLQVLREVGITPNNMLIIQDPVFMRRMVATFAHQAPEIRIVSLPAYDVEVNWVDGVGLVFEQPTPHGMWSLERYLDLLSGEVPRLQDSPEGYGPQGRDYIVPVIIPPEIADAQHELETYLGGYRQADAKFEKPLEPSE